MRINIFYSDSDNRQLSHGELNGWIDGFVRILKIMLGQLSGRKVEFRRVDLEEEITMLGRMDLLFISEASLCAKNFGPQVDNFVAEALTNRTASDLYLVLKSPLNEQRLPNLASLPHVYEFFQPDGGQYQNFFNKMEAGDFWLKMGDLAYDLYSKVNGNPQPYRTAGSKFGKVFVSACAPELEYERKSLIRDLEHLGLEVTPTNKNGRTGTVSPDLISSDLKESDFSIHLIGQAPGSTKINGRGLDEIQIDLALQQYMSQKLINPDLEQNILCWIDSKPDSQDVNKDIYRNSLIKKIESYEEIKTFRGPLEQFKEYMEQRVQKIPDREFMGNASYIKNANPISIYFIYEKRDEMEAAELISKLRRRGFTVFNSVFNTDILALRHVHGEFLRRFDVAILFSLRTSVEWANMKILDIMKAPGMGRQHPISGQCIISNADFYESLHPSRLNFDFIPYEGQQSSIDIDLYFNHLLEAGVIHH